MFIVNISYLGIEVEVQLVEVLVVVSEVVVVVVVEGDDILCVVVVEEIIYSEDDVVLQQVGVFVLNICWCVYENFFYCLVIQFLLFFLGEC